MLQVSPGCWALVTGASSGIGESIARKLCERRIPVVLVARSAARLEELAGQWTSRYQSPVLAIPLDLSRDGAADRLAEETEGAGKPIDLLVNNAGFGFNGPFEELPAARLDEMLRLNVSALSQLTHLVLPAMKARRHGRILNVASTAAYLPVPYMASYAATKAYVLSLSQALHEEAKGDGITVTCLCPGYTRTRFHDVAGMRGAEATVFPEMSADDVAEAGLAALERGRAYVVPHVLDRLWIASGRLVPRWVPATIAAWVFRRTQKKAAG